MPAPVDTDNARNPSLLTALFWVGVALAPVAALILLVADGNGPLRFAAVLAILAVVLIGLSIALRADGGSGSEEMREEIEQLRRELRGEVVAAAQRGNQALDQAQRAQEAVGALRRRLDAGTAALSGSADGGGAGRARVPADEPAGRVHVPDSGRWGDRDDDWDRRTDSSTSEGHPGDRPAAGSAGVYGAERPAGAYGGGDRPTPGVYGGERPAANVYGGERPAANVYGGDRPAAGVHGGGDRPGAGTYGGGDRPAAGVYGSGDRSAGGYGAERPGGSYGGWSPEPDGQAAPRPLGVVRHTETVHVTTRHTIVDGGLGDTGTRYGGYGGRWSPGTEERPWAGDGDDRSWSGPGESDDRSWSGRDSRDDRGWTEQDEPARSGQQWDDRSWADQRDDRGWGGERSWDGSADGYDRGRGPDGGAEGEYWSQMRTGDRWAAVREDDRGRELRVGERRAEVLADQSGTEFRVADRWAAVRRDDPGRDREDSWRGGWNEPEERPALPTGGVPVPDEWRVPRQRQPEPQWSPEPGRYGHQDDRWR